jgi:hypothetical protein
VLGFPAYAEQLSVVAEVLNIQPHTLKANTVPAICEATKTMTDSGAAARREQAQKGV